MALKKNIVVSMIVLVSLASGILWAAPVTRAEAENAVMGWLNSSDAPMGASIGWDIEWTDAYSSGDGSLAYYVVYLLPSGFVIVSGDDRVEPIIGFVSGYAYFNPSPDNALGALVSRDLPSRINAAEQLESRINQGNAWTKQDMLARIGSLKAKIKWRKLKVSSNTVAAPGVLSISDVRVPALMSTAWGQDTASGTSAYCFNYYTPNHYYDGCVATAMAQFMRYSQWPIAGVGRQTKTIRVSSVSQTATTRGGNGTGGPYNWRRMDLSPDASSTAAQREAIGALCYDAGVAASMQYGAGGSGAYMHDARNALVSTFRYTNAVMGGNEYSDIGAGLVDMINPNLDAGNPVLLAIFQITNGRYGAGHAIVSDGYGYNDSTLYHHLNLGWDGQADAWYNLPNINAGYAFNTVVACIYNIYAAGSGEIISGRVTDSSGNPVAGVTVTATSDSGTYTTATDGNGIYALVHVLPNTPYTVSAASPGLVFDGDKTVTTGLSTNGQLTSGNRGRIDFVTDSALPSLPSALAAIEYPTSATGQVTVRWSEVSDATAYELMRSLDSGASWLPVYIGPDTSYSETLGAGYYRYSVRALNPGGVSDWKLGLTDCAVWTTVPAAPASITYPATNKTGSCRVCWSAATGATTYTVVRSRDMGRTWSQVYSGMDTAFTDTVVSNGLARYGVRAVNSIGISSLKVGTVDCVVTLPPAVPASISYPAIAAGQFTVRWAASVTAIRYVLLRSADGGTTWTQIYSGTATSYAQSLGNGQYRYAVRAVNLNGASAHRVGVVDCRVARP
jgi:hypothetical protein